MRTSSAASSRVSLRECGKFRTRVLMLISHLPLRNRKHGDAGTTRQLEFSQQGCGQREFLRACPGHQVFRIIDVVPQAFSADDTAADASVAYKRLVSSETVVTKARRDQVRPAHRQRIGSAIG